MANNVIQFPGRKASAESDRSQLVETQWSFRIAAETFGPIPTDFQSELNQAVGHAVSQTLATFGHVMVNGVSDMHFDCQLLGDDAFR